MSPDSSPATPTMTAARSTRLDDAAYLSPMAAFLALTWAGGHWPSFFVPSYVLKTVVSAALIIFFWRRYTPIRWSHAWLGVAVGILGIFQWVGMELFLLKIWKDYPRPSVESFNPMATTATGALQHFSSTTTMWSFIILRWAGASLMVPFMEELFWRDYLWRNIQAPNDFKLAAIGEWDWRPLLIVSLAFASVHVQWMTAIVWGLMIGGLLVYTRSLGACIIAHGVTNFLLGAYVQYTHDWYFW